MAGYSRNREENYEIKYLRKVLGQVDKRVRVPQSLDASSLRALLDDVSPPPRETARRSSRPLWLSLQSGIVYAAAFALIVALFYSVELYRPEMINGGMRIGTSEKPAVSISLQDHDTQESADGAHSDDIIFLPEPEAAGITEQSGPPSDNGAEALLAETGDDEAPAQDITPRAFSAVMEENIGGAGISTLLLEQDGLQYRERQNDITDPDYPNPVTFEIVDSETQEILAHVDVPGVQALMRCLVSNGRALLIGYADADVHMGIYDIASNPSEPAELFSTAITGSLVDARIYRDTAYIATISDDIPDSGEVVELPHSDADESCAFTAIDLLTLETGQKVFTGAKGSVQLHNLNAYIHYEGVSESGDVRDYIGQIILDGTDIELGTVN